jgi:ABC-type nitrate/sulfonate/bicarbonate transport system substrate-binding protein
VAGVPEHFNLPWHMAIESEAFKRAGVGIEFQDIPGGTGEMMRGFREKKFDIAIVLAEGAVAALLNGNPSRMVKVFVESPLIWGIHVAADSPINHVEQIKDQRYAISRFGSGSHLMAIVDAAERDWPTDNLQFEKIENLEGARGALANGEADVFFWERFTTSPYVQSSEFRRVGERRTRWPAFVVCVRKDVLDDSAEDIKTVLDIVNESCATLMASPNACEVISQRYHLQLKDVQEWYAKTRWSTDFQKPTAAIEQIKDYLSKLNIVAENADLTDIWFEFDPLQ